ncbi:uncharacterized protein LOC133888937 [Phragmites australis]|uniref:uncharacterized protein LOC133888937 n=1 Tax=Phragmites australis TaxID=29695 RepID=UPI002D7A1FDA|nr:uncharacterized protein LOC133888937 [Phragmites australis]
MASGGGKAKAAMGMGTVEALKDQAGMCHWNYAFRSAQQRVRGAAAGNGSSCGRSDAHALPSAARRKAKQQEEELRTVMYLSNWGPNN